jgi:excisionase family DNA binding protein
MTSTDYFYMTAIKLADRQELAACLTTEEVLAYLNVTPRTIYRLIRMGELPAIRIGRQWRFRQSDLDAFVDRQRVVSA